MTAGRTYASAGKLDRARRCFEGARAQHPEDPEPYTALLTEMFVAQKDAPDAETVLKEGLDAGVDPVPLFAAFAQVAQASGQPDKARAALVKMVEYEPTYDNLLRLGSFYLGAHDNERAAQTFRRATEVDPANPRAWVGLAGAEDGAYQYVAADRDYLRARWPRTTSRYVRATPPSRRSWLPGVRTPRRMLRRRLGRAAPTNCCDRL